MRSAQTFGGNRVMAKKITTLSMFLVFSVALSFLESILPAPIPVPGVKIGLGNLAPLYLIRNKYYKEAFAVNLVRIVLMAVLFGGVYSFVYSFAGFLLSFFIMLLMQKLKFSGVAVSAAGGMAHNIGQVLASLIFFPPSILWYLTLVIPLGALLGGIMGFFTDFIIKKLPQNKVF